MTTLPFPTVLLRLRFLLSCIACAALVSLAAGEEAPSQKTGEKFLPEGQFVWHEIVTPDPRAAEKFYSSVFDWKVVRAPVSSPGEIPYVMFLHDGQIFAGIAAAGEGATRARWSCWVQVADVGAAAREASKSGGLVVRPPREHLIGRVAEVADPGQARLCLVELHIRRPFVALPPIIRHRGEARAAEGTGEFYRKVTGWDLRQPSPAGGAGVVVAGRRIAELRSFSTDTDGAPGWLPCLQVENLRSTIARAVAAGGRQVLAPADVPGLGRAARLADPRGAEFWVVER